jgi:hypothetical protein
MLKNINGINKGNKYLSHRENMKYSLIKQNTFLEYEVSIIIKRKKKELSLQSQKLKINKKILEQVKANLKLEISRIKKINQHIISLEKDIENLELKLSKIKKKKIYNISSILKLKYLFKSSNVIKKYLFLFNIGLNGEKNDSEFFDIIINNDDDEFIYYLNYLEKYYINLQKENSKEYDNYKMIINDFLDNDNLSYPYDKLLFYLDYIIKSIDLTNALNEKYKKIKEIELKKNNVEIKIKSLESSLIEKNNYIRKLDDYIELITKVIKKYIFYRNQYKNNLITKEIYNKKIRKIQSFNIQKWNPDNPNKSIILIERNNNHFPSFMTISPKSNYNISPYINNNSINSIIFNTNISNNSFSQIRYESKSQDISRNISFEYISKMEKPLSKKCSIENNDLSNDNILDSISDNNSDKENISENNEMESPISKINFTKRKKSTLNISVYKKKLSTRMLKNVPFPRNKNSEFDSIAKNSDGLKNSCRLQKSNNDIFKNIINKKDTNTNSTSKDNINTEDKKETLKCDSIMQDINIINKSIASKEELISSKNKIKGKYCPNFYNNNDKKKGLYFIKKIKKSKKFVINREKLFNKDLPTKLNADTIKNASHNINNNSNSNNTKNINNN